MLVKINKHSHQNSLSSIARSAVLKTSQSTKSQILPLVPEALPSLRPAHLTCHSNLCKEEPLDTELPQVGRPTGFLGFSEETNTYFYPKLLSKALQKQAASTTREVPHSTTASKAKESGQPPSPEPLGCAAICRAAAGTTASQAWATTPIRLLAFLAQPKRQIPLPGQALSSQGVDVPSTLPPSNHPPVLTWPTCLPPQPNLAFHH